MKLEWYVYTQKNPGPQCAFFLWITSRKASLVNVLKGLVCIFACEEAFREGKISIDGRRLRYIISDVSNRYQDLGSQSLPLLWLRVSGLIDLVIAWFISMPHVYLDWYTRLALLAIYATSQDAPKAVNTGSHHDCHWCQKKLWSREPAQAFVLAVTSLKATLSPSWNAALRLWLPVLSGPCSYRSGATADGRSTSEIVHFTKAALSICNLPWKNRF